MSPETMSIIPLGKLTRSAKVKSFAQKPSYLN